MIAVVAPEPVAWLSTVVTAAAALGPVRVVAPWAMRARERPWLPAAARRFVQRRAISLAPDDLVAMPGWWVGESMLRAWARNQADRALRARFLIRRACDQVTARWVKRQRAVTAVIAPSCAAERTFAACQERGIATFLLEDLPAIRQLHRDLDAALAIHPDCAFLNRFRAPSPIMARQEVERVLARFLLVRGAYARAVRESAGIAPDRLIDLDIVEPASRRESTPRDARAELAGHRVLLAGLAAARHGTVEALQVLEDRPHLSLLVRLGDGAEPARLFDHPRVLQATASQRQHLTDVAAVIAPAWCEAYLPEVARASRAGIPVIATARAAGFVAPTREVPVGDADALGRAIDAALAEPRPARARAHTRPLDQALRDAMGSRRPRSPSRSPEFYRFREKPAK